MSMPISVETLAVEGYLSLPIPQTLRQESLLLARRFYDQPLEERLALSTTRSSDFLGYVPSEQEVEQFHLNVPVFTGSRKRGYCSYDFITDPRAFSRSGLRCTNKWPADHVFVGDIKRVNKALRTFTRRVAKQIFELIDRTFSPDLPNDALDGTTCSMTRFLLYDETSPEGVSKAHTDYEFISVL